MGYIKLKEAACALSNLTNKERAVDEARTRDLHLGKVALYQLSYYRISGAMETVRAMRLELIRHRHQILSLARLPFRHARVRSRGQMGMTHWRFELQTP